MPLCFFILNINHIVYITLLHVLVSIFINEGAVSKATHLFAAAILKGE